MADNLQQRGGRDRSRINVNERWEVDYWSTELGVQPEQLRLAVAEAGPEVADVRRYLANQGVAVS
jgi:hypothetical protein